MISDSDTSDEEPMAAVDKPLKDPDQLLNEFGAFKDDEADDKGREIKILEEMVGMLLSVRMMTDECKTAMLKAVLTSDIDLVLHEDQVIGLTKALFGLSEDEQLWRVINAGLYSSAPILTLKLLIQGVARDKDTNNPTVLATLARLHDTVAAGKLASRLVELMSDDSKHVREAALIVWIGCVRTNKLEALTVEIRDRAADNEKVVRPMVGFLNEDASEKSARAVGHKGVGEDEEGHWLVKDADEELKM